MIRKNLEKIFFPTLTFLFIFYEIMLVLVIQYLENEGAFDEIQKAFLLSMIWPTMMSHLAALVKFLIDLIRGENREINLGIGIVLVFSNSIIVFILFFIFWEIPEQYLEKNYFQYFKFYVLLMQIFLGINVVLIFSNNILPNCISRYFSG